MNKTFTFNFHFIIDDGYLSYTVKAKLDDTDQSPSDAEEQKEQESEDVCTGAARKSKVAKSKKIL